MVIKKNTAQLTTGLPSSSKNVSNNSKNKRTTVKRKNIKKGKREKTATRNIEDPPELNKVLPSLADIKAITKPSKDADLPVDILLLTVTNCEFLACYSELKNPYRCWFDDLQLGYVYFSDVGESQEELKVALLRCLIIQKWYWFRWCSCICEECCLGAKTQSSYFRRHM